MVAKLSKTERTELNVKLTNKTVIISLHSVCICSKAGTLTVESCNMHSLV